MKDNLNYIKCAKGSEKAFLRWIDEQPEIKKLSRKKVKVEIKKVVSFLIMQTLRGIS
jgi:hypothetical protein